MLGRRAAGVGKLGACAVLWMLGGVATLCAEVPNPNGVAVIIGNKTYKHDRVPDVSFADRDAKAFKWYVLDVLGFDEANVIELHDATQADMETAFGNVRDHEGELWRYLDPAGDSDVVVFYSGHGVPGQKDQRGYLLPTDGDPDTAQINGYPIDLLYEILGKLSEARTVTVYLDACFSGDSAKGMLVGWSASPVSLSAELPEGVATRMTVLTAASGTELASWDEEAGHGLFTNHLLDALYGNGDADGDGQVTAGEVESYLKQHMTKAARRQFGRHQNAGLRGLPDTVLSRSVNGVFPDRPVVVGGVFPPQQEQPTPREVPFRDCAECPEMVTVAAGSYSMGSLESEQGRNNDEGPVHLVDIAREFAVGVYEVTFDEWDACVRNGGCKGYRPNDRDWGRGTHPVINVSWNDAQSYLEWLTHKTGSTYRLLSESEWEYVARSGTRTPFHTGTTISPGQANYDASYSYGSGPSGQYRRRTVPVGSFAANTFGLHDVHGNVWEWVADCWNSDYSDMQGDGSPQETGECDRRVLRGGSWLDHPNLLRSANRGNLGSAKRSSNNGFRVARSLDQH